ncbi:helix-turn-helix domain-containing protein [Veillonella parvula]|uniref:helix-turn-helix domain-containing protein n=1 Tax=Veillonella parvula TaxID=29466 RepID=UPI000E688AD0|nr:helix-turn-helix transcriptional regulator [Veillonella parvula]RIW10918.1 XRE family transcriptional regulator [Veillonella parvula]
MTTNKGDRIKNLRINNKMTLEEVGEKIGVSKQTLYKYENNIITNIPSDKIEGLAKVFNISPAVIMGWDKDDEQYYQDKEAAEYAEILRTRPEMRLLLSASREISKEKMQEVVNYIEFIKSRHKNK